MNEQSIGQQLISLVLDYAATMNAIEYDVYTQSKAAPEQDLFPVCESLYRPVFEAYTRCASGKDGRLVGASIHNPPGFPQI